MANLAEDLIAFILADGTVSATTTNVHYNQTPSNKSTPYIFIQQSGREVTRCLDGAIGPENYDYIVEATAENINAAKDLADDLLTLLDGHTGTMAGTTVAYVFAEDLGDDIVSRQDFGEAEDFHVSGINLRIGKDAR